MTIARSEGGLVRSINRTINFPTGRPSSASGHNDMNSALFVECECTQRKPVTPSQCGTTVKCYCGRSIAVPRLSQLKLDCGQSNLSTLERCRVMLRDLQLPKSDTCQVCNLKRGTVISCVVQCESEAVHAPGYWTTLLKMMLAPWMIASMLARDYHNVEHHGRDTAISLPVPVCDQCEPQFRKSEAARRDALRRTDIYAKLLDEFPDAFTRIGASG